MRLDEGIAAHTDFAADAVEARLPFVAFGVVLWTIERRARVDARGEVVSSLMRSTA
jgi:hypothetical protein